ncbi:MAG: hypothetical protein H6732_04090 [Alphaproteobacteria bacterium]|nr:hypothetical protein [Alphaproteobacteria bacterium]
MTRHHVLLATVGLAAGACVPPPPAPDDLNELTRYLFHAQPDEDPRVPSAGLVNLEAFLLEQADEGRGVQVETGLQERSWALDDLTDDDVESLPRRPDRPLSNAAGLAVAYRSSFPVRCHAELQTRVDQVPIEPTATEYVRRFPEVDDPSCFADGSCTELITVSDARRANAIFAADFVLYKNFRLLEYELDDGTPRTAMLARSWFDRSWEADDGEGGNALWQSYSTDVWIDLGGDTALRIQTLWNETELYIVGIPVEEETQLATVKSATNDIFRRADEVLTAEGACP